MSSNNHYIFFQTLGAKNATLKCGHWLNHGIVTQIVPKGAMVLVNGSMPLVDIPRSMLNRNVKDGVWVKWDAGNKTYNAVTSAGNVNIWEQRDADAKCFVLGGRLVVVPDAGNGRAPVKITAGFAPKSAPKSVEKPAAPAVQKTKAPQQTSKSPLKSLSKRKTKSKSKSKSKRLVDIYKAVQSVK